MDLCAITREFQGEFCQIDSNLLVNCVFPSFENPLSVFGQKKWATIHAGITASSVFFHRCLWVRNVLGR